MSRTQTGAAGQGAAWAKLAALTERVMKAIFATKRRIAVTVLLAASVVLGVGLLTYFMDAASSEVLKLDGRGRVVTWSPDGKTLAVVTKVEKFFLGYKYRGNGNAIKLWDVDTGKVREFLAESTQPGLAFGQVVFSLDGRTIAAAAKDVVEVWDAKTLDVKQTLGGNSQLVCVAFSPDGKLVAAGDPSNKSVKLWNAETGSLERTLDSGEAQPWSVVFSPDGKTLVVGGLKDDRAFQSGNDVTLVSGQVQFWDAQTWTLKHVLKPEKYVNTVAFSANGKLLASGGDLVQLWDAEKGELIHSLKGLGSGTRSVAFSPDSLTVAAGGKDGKVRLWDVQTGNPKAALKERGWGLFGASEIYSLAFSPDGKILASASQDQAVHLWRMPQGGVEKK
jgi:WD40 repeat protein